MVSKESIKEMNNLFDPIELKGIELIEKNKIDEAVNYFIVLCLLTDLSDTKQDNCRSVFYRKIIGALKGWI